MAQRFFSDFPTLSTVIEKSGMLTKAWSLWFRDLYNQVNKNVENIETNTSGIEDNNQKIEEIIDGEIVDHNELEGLQGGTILERNHLTNDQLAQIGQTADHNSLEGLQGGLSEERNHLSDAEKAIALTGTPYHNDLEGLQGGATGEAYHLTESNYSILDVILLDNTIQDSTSSIYTEIQNTTSLSDELIQDIA